MGANCSVECATPSGPNVSTSGDLGSNGDISGPGVVASFVVSGWLVVITTLCYYFLSFDPGADSWGRGAASKLEHAVASSRQESRATNTRVLADDHSVTQGNPVDAAIVSSARRLTSNVLVLVAKMAPARVTAWTRLMWTHTRLKKSLQKSILIMSDIQVVTGLGILISSYSSLCPTTTAPGGLSAYYWHTAVFLAWFSSLAHQAALTFLRPYFREHPWQRNWRLALMSVVFVLLLVSMVPTLFFNWYHKRFIINFHGIGDVEPLLTIIPLGQSAAMPATPALCFFNMATANALFASADRCPWAEIQYKQVNSSAKSGVHVGGEVRSIVHSNHTEHVGMDTIWCNHDATLPGTAGLQSTIFCLFTAVVMFCACVIKLFDGPSDFFYKRIRVPLSQSTRKAMKTVLNARDGVNGRKLGHHFFSLLVEKPTLAAYLSGRMVLDYLTSELFNICLLIFSAILGSLKVLFTYIPQLSKRYSDGWTFGQVLAVVLLMSPFMTVLQELLKGGNETWAEIRDRSGSPAQEPLHADAADIELAAVGGVARQTHSADNATSSHHQGEAEAPKDGEKDVFDDSQYRGAVWRVPATWLLLCLVFTLMAQILVQVSFSFNTLARLSGLLALTLLTFPMEYYMVVLVGIALSDSPHVKKVVWAMAVLSMAKLVMPVAAVQVFMKRVGETELTSLAHLGLWFAAASYAPLMLYFLVCTIYILYKRRNPSNS